MTRLQPVSPPDDAPACLTCSVGIMAYNEAGNIRQAIESILAQELTDAVIAEVIVVASGCDDETVPIVSGMAALDGRIRLITQERREGKASAINLFLAAARSEVLVMASADVIIKPGSLNTLIAPLRDPDVGMVGAHPIPVNDESTFLGFAVHMLWRLHDRIARETPKLGEVVAFRAIVPNIPRDTPVDEISIQAIISQLNYRLVYEPRAIVYNRGPASISDYLRQRRRINSGHLRIRQQQRYAAPTMSVARIVRALIEEQPFATPRGAWWTLGTVGLEALARALGMYDQARRRPHYLWQMALTTKAHIAGEATASPYESVLVFHIADYHQLELELGMRGAQALTQQLTAIMRQTLGETLGETLGARAVVMPERNGSIIALLPVDQDAAESAATSLITTIQATPLRPSGHGDPVSVRLACGMIAFMQPQGASAKTVLATT